MSKKEYWCADCEASFDIKFQKGYEVKFCPFCGAELSEVYSNELIDEDD